MKNLKKFSELNEGGKIEIWPDVESCWHSINVLHTLMDEGYFDNHGFPKNGVTYVDANGCLAEAGLIDENNEFFKSEEDMVAFTNVVKKDCNELTSKL